MAAVAERSHADIIPDPPRAPDPVSVTMPPDAHEAARFLGWVLRHLIFDSTGRRLRKCRTRQHHGGANRGYQAGATEDAAARRRKRKHALLAVALLFGGNLARLRFGDGFSETAERFSDRLHSSDRADLNRCILRSRRRIG